MRNRADMGGRSGNIAGVPGTRMDSDRRDIAHKGKRSPDSFPRLPYGDTARVFFLVTGPVLGGG